MACGLCSGCERRAAPDAPISVPATLTVNVTGLRTTKKHSEAPRLGEYYLRAKYFNNLRWAAWRRAQVKLTVFHLNFHTTET
jgi:hypothetical protein